MIPFKFLSPYREERTSLAVRQLIIHQKEALLLIPVFCCYQITINSIPRIFTYIRKVTLSCVTFHLMQSFSRFRAWKSFCYSHIVGASFCTKTICNDNANISTLTGIISKIQNCSFIQHHNFPLIYAEFYKPNIT